METLQQKSRETHYKNCFVEQTGTYFDVLFDWKCCFVHID